MVEKAKGRKVEVVTREYTINLHKRLHGWYSLLVPSPPYMTSSCLDYHATFFLIAIKVLLILGL